MQVLRHHGHRLSGQDRRRTSQREQPTTSSTWKASKVWCSDLGELEPPDSVRVKLVIIWSYHDLTESPMPVEAEDIRSSFLATTVHLLEMNGESYRLKRSWENAAAQAPDELDNP